MAFFDIGSDIVAGIALMGRGYAIQEAFCWTCLTIGIGLEVWAILQALNGDEKEGYACAKFMRILLEDLP